MTRHTLEGREGHKVPAVDFRMIRDGALDTRTNASVFANRTVVVFSLPGAFTPTCSSAHVPRYNELAPLLAQHGVDEVLCVSVNDAFVMDAWARDQAAPRVTFLADGNGEFTDGMGMLVDKSDLGFGGRSWRYSMLVRNGVIEKQFIEADVPGDPYEVSDADTMLESIAPGAARDLLQVTLFTKPGCGHCTRAKSALRDAGIAWEEVVLGGGISTATLRAVSGRSTTPQVFINGAAIGGADELEAWLDVRGKRAKAA